MGNNKESGEAIGLSVLAFVIAIFVAYILYKRFKPFDNIGKQGDKELEAKIAVLSDRIDKFDDTISKLVSIMEHSRARGKWGEYELEYLLQNEGFVMGRDYFVKERIETYVPDIVIKLPENSRLIIDSKFPMDNYLNYINNGNDERYLKQFLKDVKGKIEEVAKYNKISSVGFSILFVPSDNIYRFILENDRNGEIYKFATSCKVLLVSPITVMAIIWLIRRGVNNYILKVGEGKMIGVLTEFNKNLAGFMVEFKNLGDDIQKLKKSYDSIYKRLMNDLVERLEVVDILKN